MSGGQLKLPVVVRTTVGSRHPFTCGAAQHSQSLEALFMHIPGLKIVTFSTPYDAKGLLKTAIRDDDPVLFFEHKLLYYARRAPKLREWWPLLLMDVPEEDYTIPFGVADVKRKGSDVTVVATQLLLHKALNVAERLSREGIEVEVIDPRTLVPLDRKTIVDSVKKTGRVVVAHESCLRGGVAAELASVIIEEAFDYLDAPIIRIGAKNTPIPFSPPLEEAVIPQEKDIEQAIRSIL
jgi:pyruvate dehydrogenase E1 component beta subunit